MPDGVQDIPTPDEPSTPHEPPARPSARFDPAAPKREALRRVLAESDGALAALAVAAREVVPVALESVVGQSADIAACTPELTDFASLAAELANLDHLGFELQVAFSETEVFRAGLLVPSDGAALFGLQGTRKLTHTADFDSKQMSAVSERLREFLDLLSLTLFTDGLAGTQVTLADLHRGRAEWTLGLVRDLAQNSPPVRVDVVLTLESGVTTRVTLILPGSLLVRLAASPPPAAASTVALASSLSLVESSGGPARPTEILFDSPLRVSVELGGSSMTPEEILELGPGSVVELNQLAAEPVDILVNDRLIARGEVLVVDEKFGVRIIEISSPRQRANAIER